MAMAGVGASGSGGQNWAFKLESDGDSKIGNSSGDLHQVTGTLAITGDVQTSEYIYHLGDTDTKIQFIDDQIKFTAGDVDFLKLTEDAAAGDVSVTFNQAGADMDFIIESPSESRAVYLNSGNEVLHINHGETGFKTKIHSTNGEAITVNNSGLTINEDAHATNDFRVESAGEDQALFLDSSANTFYINKGATGFTTIIKNNNQEAMRIGAAGVIFNDYNHASNDFRIESDSDTHILFVNSGTDRIGIGTNDPDYLFDVDGVCNATTLSIGGTSITSTAAEINKLDESTVSEAGDGAWAVVERVAKATIDDNDWGTGLNSLGVTIPDNSIITKIIIDTTTTFVGGVPISEITLALYDGSTVLNELVGATMITSEGADQAPYVAGVMDLSSALGTFKLTDDGELKLNVTAVGAALTAGVADIYIYYIIGA